MLTVPPIAWIGFGIFFLVMLALDLGVFHRRSHVVTFRESLAWTLTWVTLALLFGAGLWKFAGHDKGVEFLTGTCSRTTASIAGAFAARAQAYTPEPFSSISCRKVYSRPLSTTMAPPQ